ncbi:MAG: bifunctional diaminohydroxyphosphoribosylaminopyrimidine deaminase/5-amino-6-(5-phosphoribosylamino)uracil reductase RibD [Verrucomicrobiota bacterium]
MSSNRDEDFMRLAIEEALKSDPEVARPNPRVGAVIVEDGQCVSTGRFERDGQPHAERWALKNLGRKPSAGATMYVTLEPCSTKGRTGACTEALIEAGIPRVVVGALDPTPAHRGNGIQVLVAAGVEVSTGVLEEECEAINPGFSGHST